MIEKVTTVVGFSGSSQFTCIVANTVLFIFVQAAFLCSMPGYRPLPYTLLQGDRHVCGQLGTNGKKFDGIPKLPFSQGSGSPSLPHSEAF